MRRSLMVLGALVVLSASCSSSPINSTVATSPGLSAQDDRPDDDRPGVGVFPFDNGGSFGEDAQDYEALKVGIQRLLMTEFNLGSNLRIVERGRLRALLDEQNLSPDRVDAQTAARIGRLVGAKYMIFGVFIDFNGDFRLDGQIVDTETSELLLARKVSGDNETLLSLIEELADDLADAADFPPLPDVEEGVEEQASNSERVPYLAVRKYSRATALEDEGRTEEAAAMFEELVRDFPDFVASKQALEQTG